MTTKTDREIVYRTAICDAVGRMTEALEARFGSTDVGYDICGWILFVKRDSAEGALTDEEICKRVLQALRETQEFYDGTPPSVA